MAVACRKSTLLILPVVTPVKWIFKRFARQNNKILAVIITMGFYTTSHGQFTTKDTLIIIPVYRISSIDCMGIHHIRLPILGAHTY